MTDSASRVISTGTAGLDAILHGGLPIHRLHLVQGTTGTGKTTLGLQFLLAGIRDGESCLYVTLAETEEEVGSIARSHGWSLAGLPIFYRRPFGEGAAQTVLHPAEVELPAAVDALLERVESARPQRLVIDSLSELRILALQQRWFRRELIRLRARLDALECTGLLLDTALSSEAAESLLGGVVRLERHTPTYGSDRRRVHVLKMRGHEYETGYHDVRIRRGGLAVYPRLVAAQHRGHVSAETCSTGLAGLDAMLGGGLDRGTATLLLGPTGSGKSTVALRCAVAAAERGEHVLVYVFDERLQTVFARCAGIGIDLQSQVDAGRLALRQVDPSELTPGEFATEVQERVAEDGARLLVLDSLNAYLYAMPDERLLGVHLHELLSFLSQSGVTSVLIAAQHGPTMPTLAAEIDVSYLADTAVLLRIVAVDGRLTKAISVYKRRAGAHQRSVRELCLEPGRIAIGGTLPVEALMPNWVSTGETQP